MALTFKFVSYPSKKFSGIDYVVKEVYSDGELIGVICTSTGLPEDVEDCKVRYPFANEHHLTGIYNVNQRGEKVYPVVLTDLDVSMFQGYIPSELWMCKERRKDVGFGLLGIVSK